MTNKYFKKFGLTCAIMALSLSGTNHLLTERQSPSPEQWQNQLNALNYLIMRSSAINIIYGLNLSKRQAQQLRDLTKKVDRAISYKINLKAHGHHSLNQTQVAFLKLNRKLLERQNISQQFKKQIQRIRIQETRILKQSILGSHSNSFKNYLKKTNKAKAYPCLRCHATPQFFPKGNIDRMHLPEMNARAKYIMDREHVKGLVRQRGMEAIWYMRKDVDRVLSNVQKHMVRNVKCSLIPPEFLANPTRVGQAILSGDWYHFLKQIRGISNKQWKIYHKLYAYYPIRDMLRAISPGLSSSKRKQILSNLNSIFQKARSLDKIDFALQKKQIVRQLNKQMENATASDSINIAQKNQHQFLVALYLIFPGNSDIYDKVIRQWQKAK